MRIAAIGAASVMVFASVPFFTVEADRPGEGARIHPANWLCGSDHALGARLTSTSDLPSRAGESDRSGRPVPFKPIVGGRNVQPRADQLTAFGLSDLSREQAREVDRLYKELLGTARAES